MAKIQEYTQGNWAVVSLPLTDGSKVYAVEYTGGDSYCRYEEIDAIDRDSAIRICDCLAVNAC